jgi:hypothetical protein
LPLPLSGDPGLIRTADPQFRKLLLYPSELRGHVDYKRLPTNCHPQLPTEV